GGIARPHVLWFDEYYDEEFYKFHSSLQVADETDLLIIVGTSGATNLPNQVVRRVAQRGGVLIDVNVAENPFSKLALATGGYFLQQPAGVALPQLADCLA
ncbi:MAG: RNA polymerase subunit sigma, partial [Anaerolineae bacterium]